MGSMLVGERLLLLNGHSYSSVYRLIFHMIGETSLRGDMVVVKMGKGTCVHNIICPKVLFYRH